MLNEYYIDNENVNSLSPELKRVWGEAFACRNEIETILRSRAYMLGRSIWGIDSEITIAAYLLAKSFEVKDKENDYQGTLSIITDEDIIGQAENKEIEKVWNQLSVLTDRYKESIFYLVANMHVMNDPMITPESVSSLAEELLDIKAKEEVADICCGAGTVAFAMKKHNPEANITGVDNNTEAIAVAKIYNDMTSEKIEIENKDIFELGLEDEVVKKYDKIFSNYPFGTRMRELNSGMEYLQILEERIPSMSKATSSDWLYNTLIVDLLKTDGKAIAIMTNGSTWNQIDAPIRKYFVENGLIECVIALPAKMFNITSIGTSMIVFSHNNKGVRLIDATELYLAGRRVNKFEDRHIDMIIEATKTDNEISMFVDTEILRENDYVLSSNRYKNVSSDIEDGREFDEVIKRITRGAPLNAKDLDSISSNEPTDKQYLMLANVHDGLIDNNLPYISTIDKKYEKYCLTNRCLILSKNGYPYKIAVAEIKENQKILANGNLYIIEIDETKADPYYIAAYLGSEKGTAALKSITVGATIPNIGVEQLKKLIIPVPSLEKQKEIAGKYLSVKDEITMLQLKLEKAKDRMTHIF